MRVLHPGHADLGDGAARAATRSPTEEEVRLALSGNLCRCTGYQGIANAVLKVAGTSSG